ncbi:MAG: sugar transferase [Candidatus Pacebacteria bacterium]|nr:sugar transferase [Candidatus Paceibacterota bacterium]
MKKSHSFYRRFGKRIFDFTASLVGLLVSWPLWLIFGLGIKIDSAGPVFFRQLRSGMDGRPFTIYKFRTMICNAEKEKKQIKNRNEADGPVFKIKHDPRFTKFGFWLAKTGLDELPQLINILKGEMSLVGPRPLPLEETRFLKKWQRARLEVKPGLASSWTAKGAPHNNFDAWMKFDLLDIRQTSFRSDWKILTGTARMLFHLS